MICVFIERALSKNHKLYERSVYLVPFITYSYYCWNNKQSVGHVVLTPISSETNQHHNHYQCSINNMYPNRNSIGILYARHSRGNMCHNCPVRLSWSLLKTFPCVFLRDEIHRKRNNTEESYEFYARLRFFFMYR